MSFAPLPLASAEWTQGSHPLERKKPFADGKVTLLEFAPGFADPSWCTNPHILYVLEGELELELEGRVVAVGTGDGCILANGEPHRARNPHSTPLRLLAISA